MAEAEQVNQEAETVDRAFRRALAYIEYSRTALNAPGMAVIALADGVEALASVVNVLMWRDTIAQEYTSIRRVLADWVNVYAATGVIPPDEFKAKEFRIFLAACGALGFTIPAHFRDQEQAEK